MEPSASSETSVETLPWSKGLAPRYIALFLLVVYYDQLAPRTLVVGGLLPSVGGLVVGAILAVVLFFRPLALTGLTRRLRLEDACQASFGRGAAWLLPGLVMGCVHVVWFAVAISYAIDLAFRALVAFGLLAPAHMATQEFMGRSIPAPLVLWVALAWSATSALLGLVTYRLVAAVMAGYQPFVAVALAAAAGWAFPHAGAFVPTGTDPITLQTPPWPPLAAAARMLDLVLGFFATHAALGVDWGRASRGRSDVETGGWIGITMAAISTGCLALLIVAGAHGRRLSPSAGLDGLSPPRVSDPRSGPGIDPIAFTTRDAISSALGPGPFAGTVLITLSLGLLGPACFAPLLIARFFGLVQPAVPRWAWTLGGALAAWPLIVLRLPDRLDLVFTALGVTVGPLVGVLAADWSRSRGLMAERPGVHVPAVLAWLAGAGLGLSLPLAPAWIGPMLPTLAAYALAWLIQSVTARRVGPTPA